MAPKKKLKNSDFFEAWDSREPGDVLVSQVRGFAWTFLPGALEVGVVGC